MLLRLLTLLLMSAPVIVATLWFSGNPGQVVLEWMGWHVETSIPIFLLFLLVVFSLLFLVEHGLASMASLPRKWRQSRQAKESERGLTSLEQALDAAAAGDGGLARTLLNDATKSLRRPELLVRLERVLPKGSLNGAERTQAVGVKEKRRQGWWPFGNKAKAIKQPALLAGSPPKKRDFPNVVKVEPPVLESKFAAVDSQLLTSALQSTNWDEAAVLVADAAPQWRDMVVLARARHALEHDPSAVMPIIQPLLQRDQDVPAALELALLAAVKLGDGNGAWSVLPRLWRTAAPSAHWVAAALSVPGQGVDGMSKVQNLVQSRADDPESLLALGLAAVAAEQWGRARIHLVAAIKGKPNALAFQTMLKVEEHDHGSEAEISLWRRRLAECADPGRWICRECGAPSHQWEALCPHCGCLRPSGAEFASTQAG